MLEIKNLSVSVQNKAIIIITDGESHDEKAIESSEQANELGIFVHTLGMGLSKGGPIPIYNKYGNRTDYRKDRDGNTIVSKLNEQLLQQIASALKSSSLIILSTTFFAKFILVKSFIFFYHSS